VDPIDHYERVDLHQLFGEIRESFSGVLQKLDGEVEIQGPFPTIQGDLVQLRQLFQNLVGNALKYVMKDSPPYIIITCIKDPDTSLAVEGEGMICISVKDNGIGFDQKYADEIFSPFRRLVTNAEYEGSGIGLATVRKIIDRHQGSIEARSSPGKGSTFLVRLPRTLPGHPISNP